MGKIKKTILIAIFVSLAAQIKFSFITDGFIVAMSVVVMAIFVYCYEDLSPIYVTLCSGIFSPLFRMIIYLIQGGKWGNGATLVIPDMAFFFAYGAVYLLVYKYLIQEPKNIKNFPCALFICDFSSNIVELTTRSLIQGENVVTIETIVSLVMIAVCRTILIQMILLAMEAYSNLLLKKEHDAEYRKLITQASILESEIHVMEKNAVEIEEIMKQAFSLYKSMKEINVPKEFTERSLDIAKNAHEVKGDYLNIVSILKDAFVNEFQEGKIKMGDIISIERVNLVSMMKKKGFNISITTKIKTDFYVSQYFKMMSIVRNLILNGAEAMAETGGTITLTLRKLGDNYVMEVLDNGPGIDEDNIETIFYEGYSTKFNTDTGNVQRGLGLCLVRDYVENYFNGKIKVMSKKGQFTEFIVTVPIRSFEEATDEILYH